MTSMNGPSRPPGVTAAAALSAWAERDWSRGVRVDELTPFDRLTVQTENSTYDCVVVSPVSAQLLVRGGAFFPDFTPVRLAGSSLGGSLLKLGTVHVGFCLELVAPGRCIVTSPVRSIVTAPADARPPSVM
jgi:hypothetical protein